MATGTATVAIGAALLISSCGGSADEPDSTRGSTGESSTQAKGGPKPEKEASPARGVAATEASPGRTEKATSTREPNSKRGEAPEDGLRHSPSSKPGAVPEGKGGSGCSPGTSKSRCAEIGAAYEQAKQGASHVVEADECPSGLDAKTCEEAGEALEGAGGSHVVPPNECPPAMSDQQCEEAGRVYQEAIR